ncbi:type II toxin-antitoxin system RelE/ParE family toxin [Tardiphaga sp.]|jgi:plasmid stabilization system protein ParE|uniref:type II toxin-antitoxin system RelE/ParE family toxin n=1 Tax=Tardiphaga sp. TaxID=1926292 RepID=UPI0037D9DB53
MRLVFHDRALADIGHIHHWIAADSLTAADRMIERIYASLETLSLFPGMGHPGGDPGILEWAIPRTPYVAVYEVRYAPDEMFVLALFHQAQDRGA